MEESQQEWLAVLKQGNDELLKWMMDRYGNDVLRTASLLLKDSHLAEEVSQDVFLKAYRNIRQYKGTGTLRAWLLKITINRCREKMRLQSWRRLVFRDQLDMEKLHTSDLEDTASKLSMRGCIAQLPYKYREVIILHYYHEWAVKEIAHSLQESEGTVKSKLSRGRRLLRDILMERGWLGDDQ